jgi:hypothetical protein
MAIPKHEKYLLESISDALVAFSVLQSKFGMSDVYSEYFFYETILRVAKHNGYKTWHEKKIEEANYLGGDYKRLDFMLEYENDKNRKPIAIEFKYYNQKAKGRKFDNDIKKLQTFKMNQKGNGFLILLNNFQTEKFRLNMNKCAPELAEIATEKKYNLSNGWKYTCRVFSAK